MQVIKAYCVCFIIWTNVFVAVVHKLVGALGELAWSGMCYFLVRFLSAKKNVSLTSNFWNQHLYFSFRLVSVASFPGMIPLTLGMNHNYSEFLCPLWFWYPPFTMLRSVGHGDCFEARAPWLQCWNIFVDALGISASIPMESTVFQCIDFFV